MIINSQTKIAVIGLGYVGLPLAIEFAKKYNVLGFDIDQERISALNLLRDNTREADLVRLKEVLKTGDTRLTLSADPAMLAVNQVYIITVPTPIDQFKVPDLRPLLAASKQVAAYLK